ncbi:hypothetical protein DFH09DRAFT_1373618 [Mycena vulgaris]|nr:hypothetical protein DFH09DRAFT_1373618 [Mycena vulgaris]
MSLQSPPVGHLRDTSQQRCRVCIMPDARELRALGASALWSSRLVRRVKLEVALVEERTCAVALMEEREHVARDLAEAAESKEELGQQQRRRLAQFLGHATLTPKSHVVVVETASIHISRRILRPRLATVSVMPTPWVFTLPIDHFHLRAAKSELPTIAISFSDTYPRTRALKHPRLSLATTPDPEQLRSLDGPGRADALKLMPHVSWFLTPSFLFPSMAQRLSEARSNCYISCIDVFRSVSWTYVTSQFAAMSCL